VGGGRVGDGLVRSGDPGGRDHDLRDDHARLGSGYRWTLASTLFYLGLAGWAIGGTGALIDSIIQINFRFHDSVWVVAHFHTYLMEARNPSRGRLSPRRTAGRRARREASPNPRPRPRSPPRS
jgi:hypothetical protein